jgi:hypothetical protein
VCQIPSVSEADVADVLMGLCVLNTYYGLSIWGRQEEMIPALLSSPKEEEFFL